MRRFLNRILRHWLGASIAVLLAIFAVAYGVGAAEKARIISAASEGCSSGMARNRGIPERLRHVRGVFCDCVAHRSFAEDWAVLHFPLPFLQKVEANLGGPLDKLPVVNQCAVELGVSL